MSDFKIDLNSKAKDVVTGYTGIVIGRTEWLYGCRRYTLQSQEMKDGKPVEALTFDEDALEVLDKPAKKHVMKSTGGPRKDATRAQDARRR